MSGTRREFLKRAAGIGAATLAGCDSTGSFVPDPPGPGGLPDSPFSNPGDLSGDPARPQPPADSDIRTPQPQVPEDPPAPDPDAPGPGPEPPPGPPPETVAPAAEDYKALIVVFLSGGNDAYNMVVPISRDAYGAYAKARIDLAVPQDMLLEIGPQTSNGVVYGLNPVMPQLQALFGAGRAALLANVGTLTQPDTTPALARSCLSCRPPRLFSHNDQTDQWQKISPDTLESVGWCGRVADLMEDELMAQGQVLPLNLSFSGANILQSGREKVALELSTRGGQQLNFLRGNPDLRALYEGLLQTSSPHTFVREYAASHQRGIAFNEAVSDAFSALPEVPLPFPMDSLGRQLAAVTRMIMARQTLGSRRQIFFVRQGGYDTHADQLMRHQPLLMSLSENLDAFYRNTEALGLAGNITTITGSDFGRSLTVNGDGTDHGWGCHQWMVGGAVRGREIYGRMQELVPGGPEDFRGGRFVPSTSVEQMAATALRWFGVAESDLPDIFPNFGRYSDTDLGYLAV